MTTIYVETKLLESMCTEYSDNIEDWLETKDFRSIAESAMNISGQSALVYSLAKRKRG